MSIGKYSDIITVERQACGDDGYGNVRVGWVAVSPLTDIWADMLEGLGREAIAAGRLSSPRTATIRLRGSPDTGAILTSDRVIARGAVWSIRGIATVGRGGDQVELTCEEAIGGDRA